MKRILPGAAGLIALTATIGFVDERQAIEAGAISGNRITMVSTQLESADKHPAYLVEFKRGDEIVKVLIDAKNGRLLLS